MEESPSQTATWSFAVILAAVGGFLGAVGVFLSWFQVNGFQRSVIFGNELVESKAFAGTKDWTGLIALMAGLAVGLVALGALLFTGGMRRSVGSVAVVGGLVVLITAALGLARAGAVAGGVELTSPLAADRLMNEGSPALGLYVSALGGALAALAGLIARRRHAP